MPRALIQLELLPHERAALLKWNFTPQVREQLEALVGSAHAETIRVGPVEAHWLASDLTHAIVQGGCRDEDVLALSERLDYVDDTGDGLLDSRY